MNRDIAIGLLRGPRSTPGRVRMIEVPESARALSTLSKVDYADAFSLEIAAARERTPERWARTILDSAPRPQQRALLWILTSVIGLELGPMDADGFVVGWEIRHSNAEFALLAARSPRIGLSAELVFKPARGILTFATFVELKTPIAKAMWAALSHLHRQVVPYLLARADRKIVGLRSSPSA